MKTVILGAGIAGLSLSSFLNRPVIILEKEESAGGLCRSFDFEGIKYDVGPHIIFSKHKDILELHNSLIDVNEHKRLNRILLNDNFVRYPFENFLGEANDIDREWALHDFLNNPYENFSAKNMQQFFLKFFGEGMTNLYFHPYNQKIWKLDPSFLDLQMVERIPKPPKDHVISGAEGVYQDGYIHQLTFTYPREGGFQALTNKYQEISLKNGTSIVTNCIINRIEKREKNWAIYTNQGLFECDELVSTIPLPKLISLINEAPPEIQSAAESMLANSIHIVMLKIKGDRLKDQFALYIPDPNIIFHRLSRLNFLGEAYGEGKDDLFLMAEITFRGTSYIGSMTQNDIVDKTISGLELLNIAKRTEILSTDIKTFENAYVIYDLNHRDRTDTVLEWVKSQGINCTGRFGKFEYQNSDQVVYDSKLLAEIMNKKYPDKE